MADWLVVALWFLMFAVFRFSMNARHADDPSLVFLDVIFVMAGAAAILAVIRERRDARRRRAADVTLMMQRLAQELGMRFTPAPPQEGRAEGSFDDHRVRARVPAEEPTAVERGRSEISVEGPRIPQRLRFAAAGSSTARRLVTGDRAFDASVELDGEPGLVLALLDRELRTKIARFVASGGQLAAGRLDLESDVRSDLELGALVRAAAELARDLSSTEGGGMCARLARNAGADPEAGVRLKNLDCLLERFPESSEAADASRAALADPSAEVRFTAALFLKEEGLPALQALFQDPEAARSAPRDAIRVLAARVPVDRAAPLLLGVVNGQTGEARRLAVEELGRLRYAGALDTLLTLLGRDTDVVTAAAAAAALGSLGDPRAELGLLRAARSEARELRLGAVRALGQMGSVRSVDPLLRLQEAWTDADAESLRAVRDAVASIQSRLAGAGAGQLALAEDESESGRLSLATPTAGAGDLALAAAAEEQPRPDAPSARTET